MKQETKIKNALRNVKIYDNQGETFDRYTAAYTDWEGAKPYYCAMRCMSSDPFSPNGFGQMSEGEPGAHIGKRIKFSDLPELCQKLVIQDRTQP